MKGSNINWFKWGGIGGVGALFVLITILNCFAFIPAGSVGVVTRLGAVNREMQQGGNLKFPYVENVTVMDIQVQKEQQDATAATLDLQNVTTTVALNYHLDSGRVSDIFLHLSADYKSRVIDPSIQESIKATTAKYNAPELLSKRAQVAADTVALLKTRLEGRGIVVDQVSIVNFAFSPQFSQSIENKQVAQQDAEKAQYNLQQASLNAQANQVQQAALTSEILEQQAIAKWNGHLPTFLGQGSIFNIPLSH